MNNLDIEKVKNYTYFVTKEEMDKLLSSKKINIYGHDINIEFLNKILQDDKCFLYAKRYFEDISNEFKISCIVDDKVTGNIWHPKGLIIKAIEKLIYEGKITLTNEEQKRFNILKEAISFDKFLNSNINNNYDIIIDNIKYSISVKNMIEFLTLSDKEYEDICLNDKIINIYGIKKEHFIYAAYRYILDNRLITRYNLDDKIFNRHYEIKEGKVDIYAINKLLETSDVIHKDVIINEKLYNYILEKMPIKLTNLEKTIYIYIKMCKCLTYDQEFFASGQKGYAAVKHMNIDYINSITSDNNNIVCYEFNLIYAKFLSMLGINFNIRDFGLNDDIYGGGHANLIFRYDKYIVLADSVISILKSDLTYAKLNKPLKGLKCTNNNLNTVNDFNNIVDKVYGIIKKEEQKEKTFSDLITEYISLTNNIKNIDIKERLDILLSKLSNADLKGIDYYSYALQLRKILFSAYEQKENISFVIISNYNTSSLKFGREAYFIITINENGFSNEPDSNLYYVLSEGNIISISKESLSNSFLSGKLKYIEDSNLVIPGLDNKGVSK